MVSWNDLTESLKGEVQDKSKNPFFGAFIVTWCIRHWEAVFIIFNFSDSFSMDDKINRIKLYFEGRAEYDFWITICYTFGVIILGYILLNLARVISNISEKIITPLIYLWTAGKATIVTKESYDQAIIQENKAIEKLAIEINRRISIQERADQLENDLNELKNENISRFNKDPFGLKISKDENKKVEDFLATFTAQDTKTLVNLLKMIKTNQQVTENHPLVRRLERERFIDFKKPGSNGDVFFEFSKFGRRAFDILSEQKQI